MIRKSPKLTNKNMGFETPKVDVKEGKEAVLRVEAGIEQKEPTLPTTEKLQREMAALKAKVEVARLQKERDAETAKQQKEVETGKKVTERELLINEAKSNMELLAQAHEAQDYFVTMQELGDLDEADTQKLEELKTLVTTLEQKRNEIDQKIEAISGTPEVLDKIQDAAARENAQRELKQLEENFHSEFDPKIDKLVADYALTFRTVDDRFAEFNAPRDFASINEKIRHMKDSVLANSKWQSAKDWVVRAQIEGASRESNDGVDFYNKIVAMRNGAGMFEGKKKAILDSLLDRIKPIVPEAARAEKAYRDVTEKNGKRQAEQEKIKTAVKELMTETDPLNDKYEGLTGKSQNFNQFAHFLLVRFNRGAQGQGLVGPEFDALVSKDIVKERG
jgi:hypothetical protein